MMNDKHGMRAKLLEDLIDRLNFMDPKEEDAKEEGISDMEDMKEDAIDPNDMGEDDDMKKKKGMSVAIISVSKKK